MSDGLSAANREEDQVRAIERAAEMLADALKNTGDLAFFRVHPEALEIANEILRDVHGIAELVPLKARK